MLRCPPGNLRPTAEAVGAALRSEQLTAAPLVPVAVNASAAARVAVTTELVAGTEHPPSRGDGVLRVS